MLAGVRLLTCLQWIFFRGSGAGRGPVIGVFFSGVSNRWFMVERSGRCKQAKGFRRVHGSRSRSARSGSSWNEKQLFSCFSILNFKSISRLSLYPKSISVPLGQYLLPEYSSFRQHCLREHKTIFFMNDR